jgi:hypothetical protein
MPGASRGAGRLPLPREPHGVAAAPDTLTLKRHRNLEGRRWFAPVRRVLLGLLTALLILALFNMFGQRPVTTGAATSAAKLTVYAPSHLRSGLIYAARFHIHAYQDLKNATLVLDPGWAEGYTVNGVSPQPLSSGSRDGRQVYGFGHIPAGHSIIVFLSLQVNPTNIGHRSQNVELDDGSTKVLVVHRTVTIFP